MMPAMSWLRFAIWGLCALVVLFVPLHAAADANVEPTLVPTATATQTPAPAITLTPVPTSTPFASIVPSWTPAYPYPDSAAAGADLDLERPQPWTSELSTLDFVLIFLIVLLLVVFGGVTILWLYRSNQRYYR